MTPLVFACFVSVERHSQVTQAMHQHYHSMGPTSCHEWSILTCFGVLIFLWFFREPVFIFGWGDLFKRVTNRGNLSYVGDATPAILIAIFMFVLPTHYQFWPFQSGKLMPKESPTLITWDIIEKKLPWGVILFLGGGFALSDACTKTGQNLISRHSIDPLPCLKHDHPLKELLQLSA